MISVITGANRGIGYGLCKLLLAQGSTVILTSRDESKGREAVSSLLKSKEGEGAKDRLFFYPLDVSNIDSIQSFAQTLNHNHHKCDYLFNNAAIYLKGWNAEIFNQVMDTNVRGMVHLTNSILPLMKENRFGRIVNVSSGLGTLYGLTEKYKSLLSADDIEKREDEFFLNPPFFEDEMNYKNRWFASSLLNPTYQVSKAFVNAYTRALAYRLEKEKLSDSILVNAGDPGWVRTDMGGSWAPYSVERGAKALLSYATLPNGSFNGKFLKKGPAEQRF